MGKGTQKGGKFAADAAVLFAVALAVRIAYVVAIRDDPLFGFPEVDARVFWGRALALAGGAGWGGVHYRPPLFPWLLSLAVRLFGEDAGAARFLLAALSALAAPLTAMLARPIAGRGWAFVAGLFAALYAPAVFLGAELLPASTVLLLDLAVLLLLAAAERRGKTALFGAAGVALGLSALARPTILLFFLFLLVRYRKAWRFAAAFAGGTLLALAPATLHNVRAGDFVLVSSNGGLNFYMGNHVGADGRSARAAELPDEPGEARRAAEAIAARGSGRALAPSEVSRYWLRRGLAWIARDPAGWLALTARRFIYLTNQHEISDNIDFYAMTERSALLRFLPVRFGLLLVLTILGVKRLLAARQGRLLGLYALAVALPALLFFVVGRFRLPLLPFLAIAASLGAAELAALRRRRSRKVVLTLAGALFSGFMLVKMDRFDVRADMTWHYHYLCGDALFRQGRVNEALRAFEEAHRRNEGSAAVRNALGFLYAETGRNLAEAEELVRGAMQIDPARRRFYLDSLGRVLYRQGRLDEAAALFEEAIPLYSGEEAYSRAEALGHLADVREAEGREEEAAELRERAGAARKRGG